jgi:hypothetical protein
MEEELTCFGCSPRIISLIWVACYVGLQFLLVGIPASVISDMEAPMRSLVGHTVPDGAVGILPAFMMVVAGCHNLDFC